MTSANSGTDIGIVIPTYKEGTNICSLLNELLKNTKISQIVIVDDSPDLDTVDAVNSLKSSKIHVIHRTSKGGRGSAVIDGIKYLVNEGSQWIIEMDADFSHPPSQIPELLQTALLGQVDLLIGSRYLSASRIENWPLTRRIFSKSSNLLARTLLRVPVSDYTNGYRVYSRPAAEMIIETCGKLGKGFISLSEILVNAYYRGFKVAEVPTIFTNRVRGESSVNSTEIYNALTGLFKIMQLKNKLISSGEAVRCRTGNQ